jgi:hypothetical protein
MTGLKKGDTTGWDRSWTEWINGTKPASFVYSAIFEVIENVDMGDYHRLVIGNPTIDGVRTAGVTGALRINH